LKRRGHLSVNPFAAMPYPDVRYEDRQFLNRGAVERIFTVLALGGGWPSRFLRRRNVALFATLLYTGIRRGELLALRVTDLDLDRLHLTVRAETSKSRLQRVVPINSRLLFALQDYLDERRRRNLQCEYLFTSGVGEGRLTPDGLKHLVDQVKRLSGVSFHVHRFRHTFAVNFLNRGGDIAKLKQLLGHRDIRMTSAYLRCLPTSAMRTDVESITLEALL
jgi:integrase